MSAVQIAGCSGAGKSAVAAVLARRGLAAIDADDDPLLARFVDPAGAVVAEEPAAPDLAWLARHSWAWDTGRLDELIRAAGPAMLYLCGGADNQQQVSGRFTQVFLLEIDEPTMLARLDARRDHHDWGQIGDTREYLRRKLPVLQDQLRATGAIPVDARQPLDEVVDAILSRTMPAPLPGQPESAPCEPGTAAGGRLSASPVVDRRGPRQTDVVSERAGAQLRVIRSVATVLGPAGISAWLFGGWGLDARIGRITREHGDVEFWVERVDAGRSKVLLTGAGATALATQPPEEACEFTWDGVDFSTAYFDRQPDGSFIQLQGRWSDWRFPPGSFGDEPGTLDGAPVLAMSVAGMLAMKEQYPHLRNGGPWRQKDIDDIKVLRRLAAEAGTRP